jgi:hypothetical protein
MRFFGRNQNKDKDVEKLIKDKDVKKPIITYYANYIGVLSSNKSFPTENVHMSTSMKTELVLNFKKASLGLYSIRKYDRYTKC